MAHDQSKRAGLKLIYRTAGATALSLGLPLVSVAANRNSEPQPLANDSVVKVIPNSKQRLAPIGMGTWITFNVGRDEAARVARAAVLQAFFDAGGGMIDSSPMYGSAQAVLGDLLDRVGRPKTLFSATKVWTGSADEGADQIVQAHQLWGVRQFDLYQVHNLLNWQAHLPRLQAMKREGQLRYVGITTSHGRRHDELADLMRSESLDFIQLTYNPLDREAEARLLPLAAERGIAVIVNRPFQRGALIRRLSGKPLPAVAKELQCRSWAQLLLKWVVAHPSITCAIPATSKVVHMRENMAAGRGPQPDAAQRSLIAQAVQQA